MFPETGCSFLIQVELDICLLEHIQQLRLLCALESFLIVLVHIQLLLVPAFIRCKRCIGLIFVIEINAICWPRRFDYLVRLLPDDFLRVLIIKLIRRPDEAALLGDELVKILFLGGFLGVFPSERRHPQIKCVHGP